MKKRDNKYSKNNTKITRFKKTKLQKRIMEEEYCKIKIATRMSKERNWSQTQQYEKHNKNKKTAKQIKYPPPPSQNL